MLFAATTVLNWADLKLSPIALDLGLLQIRWYSLAYLAGVLTGWWLLTRMLRQPGAPMARRHADDLITWTILAIIIGGRLGFILFYEPWMLADPWRALKIWEGGMSWHGGLIGVLATVWWYCRRNGLSLLRVYDYLACVTPIGIFLGRIANFVNGELWGRPTDVPWAIIFPQSGTMEPRHPSQLYEAGLEGLLMFAVLTWMFWRTDARYYPGRLAGAAFVIYGIARTLVETVRQPDKGLEHLPWGLTMGQTLSVPMILIGLWLLLTAKGRRTRVEPIAGPASVS